jgi:hypothetical protein
LPIRPFHGTWKRQKGCYFGKSVGGGRSAFGGSLSESCGYAAFRDNCPVIMPAHSISSIRVNPRNPKANGLKKKNHRASMKNGNPPIRKVHCGDHMRVREN